ncbi:MAG: tetratricopeptide repeat protein [Prevotella sp.]|jgi:tetratricopeptide (TPR) repeat protein|nr:tetratricopeptide repeat protein [Prevotella sp.]
MKRRFSKPIFSILLSFVCLYGNAQSLDQAKTLYTEGNYAAAKPVFAKIVNQSPNNASYNQWYGVCCYETGDLENAEKHLLVANKRNVLESYRYLALIYTKKQHYDEAVNFWEGFIELQNKRKEDISEAENNLETVRKLLRMEENTEDIQVIDSMVVNKNEFLDTYHLSEESGTLYPYNKFFDSNVNASSTVYKNQKGDKIFYAKPVEDKTYTLFSQNKLLDDFSDEKQLFKDRTTDCNYPFVLSDGVTMYFASKGYGSLGGYDIFVTRYNINTDTYLAPEQMGMPFNSSANDYMFVIDETKKLGWFVTDRNQPEDKVCVYLFIPEEKKKSIAAEDPETRRARATLSSIKETWKESADYSGLVKLAYTDGNERNEKPKNDFTFTINDKATYYTLNDMKSDETKTLYSEYLKMTEQINGLKTKLDTMRDSFHKGNSSKKEQLKPLIISAENELYSLMNSAKTQEKKARNAENKRLGIKY